MLPNLLFAVLLIALLTFPGLGMAGLNKALTKKKGSPNNAMTLLMACSLSYAVFIISVLIFRVLGINITLFTYWVFLYLSLSCAALIWQAFKALPSNAARPSSRELYTKLSSSPLFWISFLTLVYQYVIGVYSEIPADIYQHLGLFQVALRLQEEGSLGRVLAVSEIFQQKSWAWYHLVAFAARISAIQQIDALLFISTWVTKTLFLVAVYYFTALLFSHSQPHKPQQPKNINAIATAACCFTALHFGVNVFSFIQYYAFAPAILAQLIYFSCIALFIVFFHSPLNNKSIAALIVAAVLTFAVNAVHQQEAMFTIIIFSLMLFVSNLPSCNKRYSHKEKLALRSLLLCLAVCAIIVYIFAHLNLDRSENIGWKLWEFGQGYGLLPDISTLNMKYQGIRVITLWGALVYLLFFLNLSRYRDNLFILAGMLSPLFTVLNPFFTDLFLRLDHSSTLFRLCYMIPLHFVAADLFIHFTNKLFKKGTLNDSSTESSTESSAKLGTKSETKSLSWPQRTYYLAGVALLVILLLPVKNTWQGLHYSRFPTLFAIDSNNKHTHLLDLVSFLSSIADRKKVLTDPTTGYVISALTRHHSWRGKFRENKSYKKFTFAHYDNDPLAQYKGYLLIVNQRTKQFSKTGQLSRHWDQFQLKSIAKYYPASLTQHIESSNHRFEKLWENNGIQVYSIQ